MIKRFAIYNETSGEIDSVYTGVDSLAELQAGDGYSAAEITDSVNDSDHWIDPSTNEVKDRSAMSPSVSTSIGQATITGLPNLCTAWVDGAEVDVTDGELVITVDVPTTARIQLQARPQYIDHEMEVEIP